MTLVKSQQIQPQIKFNWLNQLQHGEYILNHRKEQIIWLLILWPLQ